MNADRVLKLARYAYPEDKDKELRVAYMLGLDRGYEERENEEDETVTDCKEMEEEIERYSKEALAIKFPTTNTECIKADIKYIARHFAKWGAEHLKK